MIVDHLRRKFQSDSTVGIFFIYCDYKQQEIQTSVNLLGSLWKQMSAAHDKPTPEAEQMSKMLSASRSSPAMDDVYVLMNGEIGRYSVLFLLTDGFDELREDEGRYIRNNYTLSSGFLETCTAYLCFSISCFS